MLTDDDRAVLTRLGLEEDAAVCASVLAGGGNSVYVERLERALAVVLRLAAALQNMRGNVLWHFDYGQRSGAWQECALAMADDVRTLAKYDAALDEEVKDD